MSSVLTPFLVLDAIGENALVHARLVVRKLVALFQFLANVVGVEQRHAARVFEAVAAERNNISVGAHSMPKLPKKRAHSADRFRHSLTSNSKFVAGLDDAWHRQIVAQIAL